MKTIKVEWCERFIQSAFKKHPETMTGIETNCFFKMAEKAGLYTPGTYGTPISEALGKLTTVETIQDPDGNYLFSAFRLLNQDEHENARI